MYRHHKTIVVLFFGVISILAYLFKLDFTLVADMAVTVVSIAVAIYISAATVLLGSSYSIKMKEITDSADGTKSQLGVFSSYLRCAGLFSIITIVLCCLYKFPAVIKVAEFNRLISAISCGIFGINIIFLWLILIFLINSLTKATSSQ